jgi:hypothetical protein
VRSSEEIPNPVADELRRYDDHLRDVRGLAAGTRHNRCRIVEQLLSKEFAAGIVNMDALRPVDIRRFIARQLEGSPSHSAAAQVATALRSYLRYRTVCGDSVAGLNAAISSPVQWQLASLRRAPSSRTKFNGCWAPSPADAGPVEVMPSSAARWTWDYALARSRICRSTTSTGAKARSR